MTMTFAQKKRDRALLSKHWLELTNRRTPEGWEKRCSACGEWLPRDESCFSWCKNSVRFVHRCKPCDAEKQRAYRKRIKQGTHLVLPQRKNHGTQSQEIAA
jgi:hypothetical protein